MQTRNCGRKAFNKKTIQASFTGHLTGLPQDILALFQPGPPLIHISPVIKRTQLSANEGVANYVKKFENIFTENSINNGKKFLNKEFQHQVRVPVTLLEINEKIAKEKIEKGNLINRNINHDPTTDPNIDGNPFKTLFVARLSYGVTERRLRRELEEFGSISRIRIVTDKLNGKPRGYAFVEFERLEDMKRAYKLGMNRNIDGKRVIVDVERGRTVADWKPRRLGGGLGGQNRATRLKSQSGRQVIATEMIDISISPNSSKERSFNKQGNFQSLTHSMNSRESPRDNFSLIKENNGRKELDSINKKHVLKEGYDSCYKKRHGEEPYDCRNRHDRDRKDKIIIKRNRSRSRKRRYQ